MSLLVLVGVDAPGPAGATTPPTWKASRAALPSGAAADPAATLTAVACPSAKFCAAVGHYTDTNGVQQGVLSTRSGAKWTAVEAPVAAGSTNVTLTAIGCSAAGSCVAVGYYDNPSSTFGPLLITLSGGVWTQQTITGTPSLGGLLTVGCSAGAGCLAGDTANNIVDLVGGVWTATTIAGPVAGGYNNYAWDISGIACEKTCEVVGSSYLGGDPGNYSEAAVLAHGSGTSWKAALAPLPANAEPYSGVEQQAFVNGVSCPKSGACVAVGSYFDTGLNRQAMLLSGSGAHWAVTESTLPGPANSDPYAGLQSVACPSATSCVAAGDYRDSGGQTQGLIDSGAGIAWTPTEAPLPAGATEDLSLLAVSCATTTLCSIAGSMLINGAADGLLLAGAATSWTATAGASPSGTTSNADTGDVACAKSTTCIAVGSYMTKTSTDGLIETLKA